MFNPLNSSKYLFKFTVFILIHRLHAVPTGGNKPHKGKPVIVDLLTFVQMDALKHRRER